MLETQAIKEGNQIDEGFLLCQKCNLVFPIIGQVAIMWDDFENYLTNRPRLGGQLLLMAKTDKVKSFVRQTLGKITKNLQDQSIIEKRWFEIYSHNKNSRFYSVIRKSLERIRSGNVLEHGCSIGHITKYLAGTNSIAFGIDKSFYAISEAKKSAPDNVDFFIADSIDHPFGKSRFDTVVALNLFELIEPKLLLKTLAGQVRKGGYLVLSDPYDFIRGTKSVKEPLYEESVRAELKKQGFTISKNTKTPSYIPWNLRLHKRAVLQYRVDLVVGKLLQ
jgi:SAM-dependent methyltransferase